MKLIMLGPLFYAIGSIMFNTASYYIEEFNVYTIITLVLAIPLFLA